MRDAYAPLAWQCRYSGVEVPDTLWRYEEFGKGVPYSQAQPGDLIFFYDTTGYVYHVGIYAGNGMMWDAPNSTTVVRYEDVWYPNQVWVGVPGAKLAG